MAESPSDPVVDEPADEATEISTSTPAEGPTPTPTPTPDVAVSSAPLDTAASMAATLLPTAKGTIGDGDPSTKPTVEAVAPPDSLGDVIRTSNVDDPAPTVIADRVADVDIEAKTAPVTDTSEPGISEMGRHAALTSLEEVSDTNLSLTERSRPVTGEEVAGPSVAVDGATRSDPFAQVPADDAPIATQMRGRIDETNTQRASTADTEASVEETPDSLMVDRSIVEADTADRPTQQTAVGTVARADTPDAVVVLAREATAPADGVKSAPAATPQAAAPLPTAEANLWEDVRSAFDRIRSTGDGQEVLMRLRPAELGELLVQVRTQGDHISVRLVTSSAAAQQTLVDDRLRLAAELARAGFDEGSVDIGQSNAGDSSPRGDQNGDGTDADRPGRALGAIAGPDRLGTHRDVFERRDPIRTESGFRPGRTAQSTINLTL